MPVVFDNFTIHTLINKGLHERIDKQEVKTAFNNLAREKEN